MAVKDFTGKTVGNPMANKSSADGSTEHRGEPAPLGAGHRGPHLDPPEPAKGAAGPLPGAEWGRAEKEAAGAGSRSLAEAAASLCRNPGWRRASPRSDPRGAR